VAAFHAVKLAGLVVNLVTFPTLRPVDPVAAPASGLGTGPRPTRPAGARVSLLVPARDEACRLSQTLPGLLAQPADEILVLDDGSTDATVGLVSWLGERDPRLRLLTGTVPPAGWVGKNWACQQLADAADGDLLVFCDADVFLAPGALDAVLAGMRVQRAEVFSVFPRQCTGTLGERLAVPLIDEVLLSFLPHPLLRLPFPAAATANGQLLAFTRDGYTKLGGHASVADRIVEDLALARRARRAGHRLGLALGGPLVQARMYRGYAEAVRGFAKSLRGAHHDSRALLVADLAWHLVATTLPWLLLDRGAGWRLAAAASVAERLLVNAKTGRGAPAEAALVPVTAPAVTPAVLLALARTVEWKGRRYR
jgi:glycosyltransferase involved in cell wall biosynthesis